jgi:uncharacterized Zn ribbon protein
MQHAIRSETHECIASLPGFGGMKLKSEFVKKA